jgi:hypothetical protein
MKKNFKKQKIDGLINIIIDKYNDNNDKVMHENFKNDIFELIFRLRPDLCEESHKHYYSGDYLI